jgi:hypothetical protein
MNWCHETTSLHLQPFDLIRASLEPVEGMDPAKTTPPFAFAQGREPVERQMMP